MGRAAVLRAEEVAELLGISTWSVYQAARRGDTPLGQIAIRVGRRLLWPRGRVTGLLGIDGEEATR